MEDDLAAIRQIQAGDERGLLTLMARHKEAVYRFAMRFTGNEADAAGLTEEVFFRVYDKAARFRPTAKVSSWIFAIAANACRDHYRRRRKSRLEEPLHRQDTDDGALAPEEYLAGNELPPSEQAASRERLEEIEAAIRELPDKLKFPFIFCVLEEHSYDACAEVLGTNRKTVETRIYRARQKLRSQLVGLDG